MTSCASGLARLSSVPSSLGGVQGGADGSRWKLWWSGKRYYPINFPVKSTVRSRGFEMLNVVCWVA
jgi:hypothetical protein